MKYYISWFLIIGMGLAGLSAAAQEPFSQLVGPVEVGDVSSTDPLVVPYITWGGDMATFYANGGLTTKADSLFGGQGLNLKLTAGDANAQRLPDEGERVHDDDRFTSEGIAWPVRGTPDITVVEPADRHAGWTINCSRRFRRPPTIRKPRA